MATLPPIECPTTVRLAVAGRAQQVGDLAAISGYENVSVQPDRPWLGRSTRITRACSARALAIGGPVLALAEQTVQQHHPRPGSSPSAGC